MNLKIIIIKTNNLYLILEQSQDSIKYKYLQDITIKFKLELITGYNIIQVEEDYYWQ